ncbi:hypothetical protein F4680DRAFT_464718 [Xylaria scruposa]|nr:hypothetical protein F4680DRAFT_464718 [Xylaria scruposa]
MPPTPASSTEIKGQDHSNKLSSLQLTFELPPSAITSNDVSKSSSSVGTKMSPISPTTSRPPYLQPSETVKARRRSSAANQQKETFALPPPPTRSRKIIQMKPRPLEEEAAVAPSSAKGGTTIAGGSSAKSTAGATASSKTSTAKKQPSATSAAGRKIARKTAHSLIERRRRSKMNEEFAVLKGLIPACTGEMHKLAILQASIEYVRYLEDCITKLKAQQTRESSHSHSHTHSPTPAPASFRPAAASRASSIEEGWNSKAGSEAGEDVDGDVEMTDSEMPPSPTFTTTTPTPAPHSSASPVQHPYSTSEHAYAPPPYAEAASPPSSGFAYHQQQPESRLASPGLRPQQLAIDHEVSAALLMLGGGRGSASSASTSSARGMSVRDLLSS